MEIKSFKKIKSNLYEFKLNNNETHKIYDDIILKYELLIDKNVDEKKLKRILDENSLLDAYYTALKYISIKMRTKLEIGKYLQKKEFSKKAIDYTAERLSKEDYLDEKMYTKAFINDQLNLTLNGPKKVHYGLVSLGIDENIVNNILDTVDEDVWTDKIKKIIDKKFKINKKSASIFKSKVYYDLINLGYPSNLINEVLSTYEFDTTDAFQKEAEKIWKNLSNKYEGTELHYKFKQKLYSKGYTYDQINEYIKKSV